jgi:hypothetical protein
VGRIQRGFSLLNRVLPWYRLPTPFAVLSLLALRNVLREKNLYDTEPPRTGGVAPEPIPRMRSAGRSMGALRSRESAHGMRRRPLGGTCRSTGRIRTSGAS